LLQCTEIKHLSLNLCLRDQWRDLLMIDHFEAIKQELIFLWLIWLVYSLHSSYIKVPVDVVVYSEHGKIIKYDFKPESVERSINQYQKRVYLSRRYCQLLPPIKKKWEIFQWLFPSGYKNPQAIFQIWQYSIHFISIVYNLTLFMAAQSIYWLGFCLVRWKRSQYLT
jgi:hypothetical protein